jgi:hypothetical protein
VETAPRSLVFPDQRGQHRYLRVTWHADTRALVLSHWTGALCTASTRVALADMSRLIVFLVNALDRSARAVPAEVPDVARPGPARSSGPARPGPAAGAARDRVATALTSVRRFFGPHLAQVVSIGERRQVRSPGPGTTATAPCSPPVPLAPDRLTPVRSYPD